ncbi:MAG: hypothetical protein WKG52_02575 [Variovorax sp.]
MTHPPSPGPQQPGELNRRGFITQGAGLGLALGLPPLLQGCGGGGADGNVPAAGTAGGTPSGGKHAATLFFNLSHDDHAGKTYDLTGGGQRLTLTSVADEPGVLHLARQSNAFLRAVADHQITHHVAGALFANDSVTLCYVSTDLPPSGTNPVGGTWSMSSVQLYIPPAGAKRAYAAARQLTPEGPLQLSARRKRYGVGPAQTEQDLRDERALLDTASQAATLVGFQPDLMAVEPGAAHTIHSNHVDVDINVYNLGQVLTEPKYGAALPQQAPGQPNAQGWGTLTPVLGDDDQPLRNKAGQHAGRIQYLPSLHPDLRSLAKAGSFATTPGVKDDTMLGTDTTGYAPGDPLDLRLLGSMWLRHDGLTRIDQSPGQPSATAAAVKMVLKQQNGQVAFGVQANATASGSTARVTLSLTNWFLEFRGVWLQFLNAQGDVLNLTAIPEYKSGSIVAGHDHTGDTDTAMFISVIGPAFTVLAIPVAAGTFQAAFNVPASAHTVRVLSSTMSFQGGNLYPATVVPGAVMTGIVNYGITMMLCALGAGTLIPAMYKAVIIPVAQALALELVKILSDAINGGKSLDDQISTAAYWEAQGLLLAKVLVTREASATVKSLVEWVVAEATAGAVEDSIPVVGQILQAISIAVGVASVLETGVAMALAPWTYVDDLVFTHDLNVTLLKDVNDATFPSSATRYTVTAMFDNGTPYVQSFKLPPLVPATLPPVGFGAVPLGGLVNVSVAFVQESTSPGTPDIMLGKGSTGPIANDVGAAPSLTIQEMRHPIDAATVYAHRQKTQLDPTARHVWGAGAAPTVRTDAACGGAGTACAYRSISVRQGTGPSVPGYVGYAWEAQNTDPNIAPSCVGGLTGQLDQVANLNTDGTTNGGRDAQLGYANGACGIGGHGVRVAYSLLSHGSLNFYLDTTLPSAPMLRQVVLEPQPSFAGPLSGQAWGALNHACDALLLHPAGYVVSINKTLHTLETLRIPRAGMADADARLQLLAHVKSGKGSRPGLMNTPVAAAVSADGVILVLESGNNRIQAFDLGGNPVRHFPGQNGAATSPYSLSLGGTDPQQGWDYLDLAVEYTGYLYVLAYNRITLASRLDIYHPQQTGNQPISTTPNVNAARLTVDFWRNVYTLNYELLQLPGGAAPGLTEPSISLWTP